MKHIVPIWLYKGKDGFLFEDQNILDEILENDSNWLDHPTDKDPEEIPIVTRTAVMKMNAEERLEFAKKHYDFELPDVNRMQQIGIIMKLQDNKNGNNG